MKHTFIISLIIISTHFTGCDVKVKGQARCGDDRIDPLRGEQCDTTDFASQTCQSLGYHGGELACTSTCTLDVSPCLAEGRCGDGAIQTQYGERCEGTDLGGATCASLGWHGGALACGLDCRHDTTGCEATGRCGDGVVQPDAGEACDGEALGDQTCESLGFYGGTLTCGSDCAFDTAACEQELRCGDGLLQPEWGEICDGDNLDGETCLTLGFHGGALACSDDCRHDLTGCEAAGRCGDGVVQAGFGETCDGANLGGQTCQTLGFATGTLFCHADCSLDTGACFDWSAISAGDRHTCAIGPDATVWCWGANDYGQLGDGTTNDSSIPRAVTGLTGVRQVSAGAFHTCAVLQSDEVLCWGNNSTNQLGDLTNQNRSVPVSVFGPLTAEAVSAGLSHTCARLLDGTLRCWGDNFAGQLGDGTTSLRDRPAVVTGISGALSVSSGDFGACALLQDGTVRCWGANDYGQLGDGTTGGLSPVPVTVSGLSNARAVSVGRNHACSLLADGTVACWGRNGAGQCGDATWENRASFVPVYNLTGATAVSCGDSFTCALISGGALRCWGNNPYGQLGDGTTTTRNMPVAVLGLSGAGAVSCGANHVCAATDSALLYCWGLNSRGQLGDGTTSDASTPVQVQ